MKTGKPLTFRSIMISYLVLCLVMLTVTIIGYSSSIFYVQKEIRNSAALRMKEVVGKIENNIRLSYQLCDTLAVSGGLDDLAAIEGNFSPQQILDSMKLKNTMSELNVQNNLCQNLHIYFLKSDSILSSNTQRREGKEDIGFFCRQYGITTQDFYCRMTEENQKSYQILSDNLIWFFRPVDDTQGNRIAVIFAEYSGSRLIGDSEAENCIYIETPEKENTIYSRKLEENQKNSYIKVEKQMNMFQWNCDMYVPNTLFYGELRRFAMILAAELLMLISVAFIGSWYFSKKTYVPVGNLIRDNKKLSKKVKKKEETQECRELEKYLTGAIKEFPYASLNKLSDKEKYIMFQFAFDENGDTVFRDQEEKGKPEELEHFVLENILKEQIFEKYHGVLLQPEKDFVAVVNLSEPENDEKEIRNLLKTVEQFYSQTFHISACIMIGQCQSDCKKMKEAYHLLEESMQYLEFWSTDTGAPAGVYVYGEMMDADEDSHSSVYMTGSRRLLNCLESEDFEGAYRELNQIYQSAFSRNQKELRINRYRMYGLIGTLITTLDISANEEDRAYYQSLNYEERLFRIQSIHELLSESRAIFEAIIQYRQNKSAEREPEWMEEMQEYIQEHYQDCNMNVTSLAQEFGISVPHVSRSFKNFRDYGVLEYIHKVRLEHAKEMLKNDVRIKNIALDVGYTDAQAFTRAFKRYEGITPSQYKELISKNEA